MKSFLTVVILCILAHRLWGQLPPAVTSWDINTQGHTGYGGIAADVQVIRYSTSYVYVQSTNIPSYTIGPWPGNPNIPTNQNWTFKIAQFPQAQSGTKTVTPYGQIGVWRNGVAFFNAKDAQSYNGQNIWHQNAVIVEAASFDACKGHPAPGGVYHNHQNPSCLYTPTPVEHSPILGYAFDGFPIYGPYGYADTNGTGGIVRIKSSYRHRNITLRTTLPDGTILPPSQYGPAVGGPFPLGYYVEDFEYVSGLGELDPYNGRFAVTPEYPSGTYAYHVTLDSTGASAYPYILGPSYYGVLIAGNTGPGGGHVVITESTQVYTPPAISTSPSTLEFGNVAVESFIIDTIRIYNIGVGTLSINSIDHTQSEFSTGRTAFSIPGGSSDTVSVIFSPSIPGLVIDTLILESNAQPTGQMKIPVRGTGVTGTTISVNIEAGWNLLSLPVEVGDPLSTSQFPNAISGAYVYSHEAGYVPSDSLTGGVGFWLKFAGPESAPVTGEPRIVDTLTVQNGWNIIGGLSSATDVSTIVQVPDNIVQSPYYVFSGGYTPSDTLHPGKGYWVKTGKGQLVITGSTGSPR